MIATWFLDLNCNAKIGGLKNSCIPRGYDFPVNTTANFFYVKKALKKVVLS